jgi:hypothetical protein
MELKMNSSWLRRRKLRHLRSASISTIANEATPLAVNPTRNDTTDMEIPRSKSKRKPLRTWRLASEGCRQQKTNNVKS